MKADEIRGLEETLRRLFRVDVNDLSRYKVSLQQALALMNSDRVQRLLGEAAQGLVPRVLSRVQTPGGRIDQLYLSILSRHASELEMRSQTDVVKRYGNELDTYEDMAWALLTSSEFIFNH
jgi:hypothetical protein